MTRPSGIRGVADTARWVALYRARESERPDAHFRDPYARRLAGPQGEQILAALPRSMRNASWSVVARTVAFDQHVLRHVAAGTTLVLNLAAGLDSRPYRLPLPASLIWIEVDQPALLAEKAELLADAAPRCTLERIALDLSLPEPRRQLFEQLGQRAAKILVLSEGLVMYLRPEEVASLARDLAQVPSFQGWVTDLISPGLLRLIDKDWGKTLRDAGAPMRFAPEEGPEFFAAHGWRVAECEAAFPAAGKLKRLPWLYHLFSLLPGAARFDARRPWSGTCLLTPTGVTREV